jgi:type II/III secretion system protein
MNRAFRLFVTVALFLSFSMELEAQGSRQVKVAVNFKQSGTSGQETIGGSGAVIIRKGNVRPQGRFGVEERQTTTQRASGIFTLVQDGGASSLLVATRVPYAEAAYYYNYLTGAGYVATRVIFQEVGTALKVEAAILPQNQIRVRLMPRISYFSPEGAGAIDVTEAATELILQSGEPAFLGGATTELHDVTRRVMGILSYDARTGASESSIAVTATIQ